MVFTSRIVWRELRKQYDYENYNNSAFHFIIRHSYNCTEYPGQVFWDTKRLLLEHRRRQTDVHSGRWYNLLQFKMKNASKLKRATVSVLSGGKTFTKKLDIAAHEWQEEKLEVEVKNGRALLTFHIEGKAQEECRIDDVCFVRKEKP